MNINKKIGIVLISTFIIGLSTIFLLPKETTKIRAEVDLRVGAGDDTSGLLLNQIEALSKEKGKNYIVNQNSSDIETFEFKDCCSNTSQWALGSDEIDMAFYCNHMALHLVNANERFEIYGPVIMNAEVLAYEGDIANIRTLGIGHKRQYLQNLAVQSYPQLEEVKEMTPSVLPYSLTNNQIDAAVIDVTKGALLPRFSFERLSEDDHISYCLVVRKDLINTDAFDNFLAIYNQAIEELNRKETLVSSLGMTEDFWDKVNIKFLKLE